MSACHFAFAFFLICTVIALTTERAPALGVFIPVDLALGGIFYGGIRLIRSPKRDSEDDMPRRRHTGTAPRYSYPVKCWDCGGTNQVSGKLGTCRYCGAKLKNRQPPLR